MEAQQEPPVDETYGEEDDMDEILTRAVPTEAPPPPRPDPFPWLPPAGEAVPPPPLPVPPVPQREDEPHSPADLREIQSIPDEIRRQVRRAHNNLGHPSRATLLRLLRLAKATQQHVRYAQLWKCEICLRRLPPAAFRPSSAFSKPTRFNEAIAIDLKFLDDANQVTYVFMNILDIATRFSLMVLLDNKAAATVVAAFELHWVSWAGVPGSLAHDQGREFEGEYGEMLERLEAATVVTPTAAAWQNGLCERHGGVLGNIIEAIVAQCGLAGVDEMRTAANFASMAKNRRPDRTGFSARARVFGADEHLPASVIDALTDKAMLASLDIASKDDHNRRTLQIREAAMVALQKLDHSDRWRRAISAGQRPSPGPWLPSAQVFYWRTAKTKKNLKGRRARVFERWHGPAVVIGREGRTPHHDEGYWISHNGRLMLVAPEHLRAATSEEQLASTTLQDILDEVAAGMATEQHDATGRPVEFEDLRGQELPPMAPAAAGATPHTVDPEPEPAQPLAQPQATHDAVPPQTPARPLGPRPRDTPIMAGTPATEEVVRQPQSEPRPHDADEDPANVPVPQDNDLLATAAAGAAAAAAAALALEYRNVGSAKTTRAALKGKELDPRRFDNTEKLAFNEADKQNWAEHVKLGAVQVISPQQAREIPWNRILPLPARFVRTNKSKEPSVLDARSRLVIRPHGDPDDGDFRVDAPVAPQVAMHLVFAIAASKRWTVGTFDVSSAFLTGNDHERQLYFRPPKEGLPGVPDGSLIQVKKGLFGLREAPRLWWLRARTVILEAGFTEVKACPATFVLHDDNGHIIGALILHVDDGLWTGTGSRFKSAQGCVRRAFKALKEKNGEFDFLGRHVTQDEHFNITVDQHQYIREIRPIYVTAARRRDAAMDATPHEESSYRSLVAQLAWPARNSVPQIGYDVSDMQQRSKNVTVGHLLRANNVLRRTQQLADAGTHIRFCSDVDVQDIMVGLVTDASFGGQLDGGSQCGYAIVMGSKKMATHERVRTALVDWGSTKIRRVVKSTLAAEACGCSTGYDRAVYIRAILSELLGSTGKTWQDRALTIPQITVVDARSLRDHLHKTGGQPTEKRVGLDLCDVREWLERGDKLGWVPTTHMLVDPFTKHFVETALLDEYLRSYYYDFRDQYDQLAA